MAEQSNILKTPLSNPVHELSVLKYGRGSFLRSSVIAVSTVKSAVIPANPNRLSFRLINNSTVEVYVLPSLEVSTSNCVPLVPNGGSIGMNLVDDGEAVNQAWYGIVAAGAENITLIETIIEGG